MRTIINPDEKRITKVMQKTGAKTKSEAVRIALNAQVDGPPPNTATAGIGKPDYSAVLAMFGSAALDPAYDPKAAFGGRIARVR